MLSSISELSNYLGCTLFFHRSNTDEAGDHKSSSDSGSALLPTVEVRAHSRLIANPSLLSQVSLFHDFQNNNSSSRNATVVSGRSMTSMNLNGCEWIGVVDALPEEAWLKRQAAAAAANTV